MVGMQRSGFCFISMSKPCGAKCLKGMEEVNASNLICEANPLSKTSGLDKATVLLCT